MNARRVAALVFAVLALGVVAFQLALAAGAPWGAYALGGTFTGRFPPALRVAAFVQAVLIAGMAVVVLASAGLMLSRWKPLSCRLIWGVVMVAVLTVLLNLITPSAGERAI